MLSCTLVLRSLGNGLVADIGSGLGRDLLGVARAYPQLRIALHDKPEVMELARDVDNTKCLIGHVADAGTLARCGIGYLRVL